MSVRSFLAGASAAAALVFLAACSSAPPSAASIARRIPGCHPRYPGAVSAYATGEVFCAPPGEQVYLGTFSSAHLARSWMAANSNGADACIQGNGWAAQVLFLSTSPFAAAEARMAKALGGREVSIGQCY